MRLRGIHLRGHNTLSDISLDFRGDSGVCSPLVCLYGGNGSGKSLLSDLLSLGWASCIRGCDLPFVLDSDFCRLDFEEGSDILSIHIRGDKVDSSNKLVSLFDVTLNRHMVLKYDSQRIQCLPLWTGGGMNRSLGEKALWPILSDLHQKDIKNSIIVIDDFDLGLDRTSQMDVFRYLRRHHRSKGNQVILLMREKLMNIDGLCIGLVGRQDPLEGATSIFSP